MKVTNAIHCKLVLDQPDFTSRPVYRLLDDEYIVVELLFPPNWTPLCDFDLQVISGPHVSSYTLKKTDFPKGLKNPYMVELHYPDAGYDIQELGFLVPVCFRFTSYDGLSNIDNHRSIVVIAS